MATKLKTNFSVINKYPAFYTGGRIQVTADGLYLFCICDRKINVVDLGTGVIHRMLAEDDADDISCFTVSRDDDALIVARRSFRLQQYEWRTGTLVRTWKAPHTAPILCMDVDESTTLLATGSSDLSVKVFDIVQRYYTHNFRANQGIVSIVRFHPDIERLLLFSVSGDNKIRVWCLRTSKCVRIMDKHHSAVTELQFVQRDTLISASRDSIVVLWDLNTWDVIKVIPVFEPLESVAVFPSSTDITRYKLRPDARHFITAGLEGRLRVWDAQSGVCTHKQDPIMSVKHRADDQVPLINQVVAMEATGCLALVTYDHSILVYDARDLSLKKQLIGYSDEVLDLRFIGDQRTHVAVVTNSEQIKVFEVATWDCRIVQGHSDIVLCIDVNDKLRLMASGAKDNTLRLWSLNDLSDIRCVAVLQGHVHAVGTVVLSRLGSGFMFSGSQDCTVKRWDLPTDLANSTQQPRVVSAATAQAHSKDINCVALAQNDKLLATGSLDKTIKVWDPSDLSLTGVMRGHSRSVWCIQFSPVDKCLASSSADGSIKIWSLLDYSCVKTFEGHDCSVLWVSFISSGLQLLSSGSDGLIKLWTIKSNECVATFNEHDGKVWSIAVSDDQQTMLSGGADSTLVLWKDVSLSDLEETRQKQDQFILMEQELMNLVAEKNFAAAIRLALRLEQPFRLLTIFKQMLDSREGSGQLEETVRALQSDQLETLLRFTSEWNKNTKHSDVAQLVLMYILRTMHPDDLLALPSIRTSLEALIPYTERHYERLTRLRQQGKFVEYTWSCMRPVTDSHQRPVADVAMDVDRPFGDKVVPLLPSSSHSSARETEADKVPDVAEAIRIAAQRDVIEKL